MPGRHSHSACELGKEPGAAARTRLTAPNAWRGLHPVSLAVVHEQRNQQASPEIGESLAGSERALAAAGLPLAHVVGSLTAAGGTAALLAATAGWSHTTHRVAAAATRRTPGAHRPHVG